MLTVAAVALFIGMFFLPDSLHEPGYPVLAGLLGDRRDGGKPPARDGWLPHSAAQAACIA